MRRLASSRMAVWDDGMTVAVNAEAKRIGAEFDQIPRVEEGSWNRILFIYGRPPNEADQIRAAEGMAAFSRYAEELVDARAREQRDDFTSALVWTTDDHGERLTSQQATTAVLDLLFAGHETTTGLLGNSFRRRLADRDAWRAIWTDPSLIPNAVEEVLRLDSSVLGYADGSTPWVVSSGTEAPP
jgi:cytochrome P450